MTNQSANIVTAAESSGQMAGYFVGTLLLAYLLSRLGLYIRRSSRFEPSTVAGVHVICFFILGMAACSSKSQSDSSLAALFAQLTIFLIDYFRLPDPDEYRDDEPQRPGAIRPFGYVAIGGALLLCLGVSFISQRPVTDEMLAADVEQGMASTEAGKLYVDAMKRNFPDDFRAMVASTVQVVRQNESTGITPKVRRQLEQQTYDGVQALLEKYRPALLRAPTRSLNVLARASRDLLLQAQRESPEICAAYALGTPTVEQMRTRTESLALPSIRVTVAMLDAAKAGLDDPVQRDVTKPPQAMNRLVARMRTELGPALGDVVGDEAAMEARPVGDRCRIGVAYYAGIARLPPEDSAALTAYNYAP